MKFSTPARGAVLLFIAVAVIKVLLMATEHSAGRNGLVTAVSISLVYIGIHFLRRRVPQRETLEIGRRGFQILKKDTAPFALAWRMIRTADLISGSPAQWRFALKNGGTVFLQEGEFAREQWKQICTRLERTFKARRIPVRVLAPGSESL